MIFLSDFIKPVTSGQSSKKMDFVYKYQMQENNNIDLFTLKIRMEDE